MWMKTQGFINEVFTVLKAMGVTSQEKRELTAYQLKDVAQVWYGQWKNESEVREGWITWRRLINFCIFSPIVSIWRYPTL